LTAAGLFFREVYADALAFEQGDGVHAGAGVKLVDDAGGKEINVGWAPISRDASLHNRSFGKLVRPNNYVL